MPKANELRKGDIVDLEGAPHIVKQVEAKNPSARGASTLYKVRFNNLITGQKRDESFKGDDLFFRSDCMIVPVQFSYIDGDKYVFMNTEDYSQYEIGMDALEYELGYITEGLEGVTALLVADKVAAINLPQSVVMKIVETSPPIKGASASARTKPAIMATGLSVQVPEYIEQGESIKINTTDGKYMSRA